MTKELYALGVWGANTEICKDKINYHPALLSCIINSQIWVLQTICHEKHI